MIDHGRDSLVVPVASYDDNVSGLLEESTPVVEVIGVAEDLER
jgi:hypothetical protein